MAFIKGYLSVTALHPESIKRRMLTHLQEMMKDGEAYGWPILWCYHSDWLQHLEQSQAIWEDEATKPK